MFKNSRSRWGLFALVLVLALAFTAMTTASAVTGPAGTLSLHVADGIGVFTYTPTSGSPQTQAMAPTNNRCVVSVSGSLVDMVGSDRGVGLVGTSVGIKTGSSSGTPCGRVDTTEDIALTLDNVPNAGSVELDLELKGSAHVRIVLSLGGSTVGTFEVRSGSTILAGLPDGTTTAPFSLNLTAAAPNGNCRNASDSGPDSGGNDNCRVSIIPASEFDSVKFTTLNGEFSLEGGGDAGTTDTVFNLVATFEGELGCPSNGDNTDTDGGGSVVGTIIRHENTDGSDCVLKPYNLTATESDGEGNPSVTFDVADPVSPAQEAAYEAYLTFDQALTTPLTANLTYDATAPYETFPDMPPCVQDPFDPDLIDAEGSINSEAIPSGDTACVVDVSQDWEGKTVWHVVFTADIKFR